LLIISIKVNISYLIQIFSIDKTDVVKLCNARDNKGRGLLDERDFEDLIKGDLNFDATDYELDKLIEYYGADCKQGFVDYRLFIDEMETINNKGKITPTKKVK